VELTGVEPNVGDWRGHFFVAFGDVDATRSVTDEQLEICTIRPLPLDMIPNLNWIIPLLLDEALARAEYTARVSNG
jgi:gamma-glutamylcysteine synthetase